MNRKLFHYEGKSPPNPAILILVDGLFLLGLRVRDDCQVIRRVVFTGQPAGVLKVAPIVSHVGGRTFLHCTCRRTEVANRALTS